jgi:hypothetical protein
MPWDIEYTSNGGHKHIWGTKSTAADGCMDIGFGLDRAAIRWPGKGWEAKAEDYIDKATFHYTKFSKLGVETVKGDPGGFYLNYFAFAHWPRFSTRTDNQKWEGVVTDNAYKLMEYSYNNYALPAWYVGSNGQVKLPHDAFNQTNEWRYDGGPSRTAWRVGAHYLTTGDPRAKKWAEKITRVFVNSGADENVGRISGSYSAETGEGNAGARPTTMSGAGVCAMGAENQAIADGAWDFLAQFRMGHNAMDDATCMWGLLIMSGIFSAEGSDVSDLPTITAPAAPANVRVHPRTSTSLLLSWDKVDQAFSYVVEKKTNGNFVAIDTLNRNINKAVVPLLSPSTSYELRVASRNTAGTTPSAAVTGTTGAPAEGEEVIAINVGGSAYQATNGVYFVADDFFDGGRGNPRAFECEGTDDDMVYTSERWGSFSYNIPVEPGEYNVTLMFAEGFWETAGKRLFNVSIEGDEVLSGFDIANLVGVRAALDTTIAVTSSGNTLGMNFQTIKDNSSISGIVVRRPGKVSALQSVRGNAVRNESLRSESVIEPRFYDVRGRRIMGGAGHVPASGVSIVRSRNRINHVADLAPARR